jgi:hypothetical protein
MAKAETWVTPIVLAGNLVYKWLVRTCKTLIAMDNGSLIDDLPI